MVHHDTLSIATRNRAHWIDITDGVQGIVTRCGIFNGICMACSVHTTAGMTINENADPDVQRDLFWKLDQLVPRKDQYRHGEGNSDSHLKSSLVGFSVQVPVVNTQMALGTWQSIYLCEFDGPRNRTVRVTVIGE